MNAVSRTCRRAGRSRALRSIAAVAGFAVLSGCATSQATEPEDMLGAAAPATVTIQNNSWDRMTVYLVTTAGQRIPIGRVEGNTSATFPLRRHGPLGPGDATFFMARPLAGTAFRSERFVMPRGGEVVWTIQNHRALSQVILR